MEAKSCIESSVYRDPKSAFGEVIARLDLGDELGRQFDAYLGAVNIKSIV